MLYQDASFVPMPLLYSVARSFTFVQPNKAGAWERGYQDSAYVCTYVCIYTYVSTATEMYMQLLQHIFLWVRHCFHVRAVEPRACNMMESPCREAAVIRKATYAATQKSGSEERRGHWWKVHPQRVRLIRQQESDDCCSQSLGLIE